MKLEFSRQIFEIKPKISSFIKIRRVGDELFHADGQTETTKRIVASSNFANAPKNVALRHITRIRVALREKWHSLLL
jgi:hypothetical protein